MSLLNTNERNEEENEDRRGLGQKGPWLESININKPKLERHAIRKLSNAYQLLLSEETVCVLEL